MKRSILSLIAIFACLASAQPVPEPFKALPTSVTCEAWDSGFGSETLEGKVNISVEMSEEPLVQVSSDKKELNFTFGRRMAAGSKAGESDFCSYVFDESKTQGRMKIKYFCNNNGETSWMHNDVSMLVYSPGVDKYTGVCKHSVYGGGMNQCWLLKKCK